MGPTMRRLQVQGLVDLQAALCCSTSSPAAKLRAAADRITLQRAAGKLVTVRNSYETQGLDCVRVEAGEGGQARQGVRHQGLETKA